MLQPRSLRPYISISSNPNPNPNPNPRDTFSRFNSNNEFPSSSSTSSSSSSSSRSLKNPTTFSHNTLIAISLIPAILFILDLSSTTVTTTLIIGLMISYILDLLNFKQPAFISLHLTLILSQFTFFLTSSFSLYTTFNSNLTLTILSSFLTAHTTFLISIWSSLQFKFLLLENPAIVVVLERLLFSCLPITASSLFTYAAVAAVGIQNSAYYFMFFNCCFYWLYSIPRISSFKMNNNARFHGGEAPKDSYILGPLESCVHALYLVFAPICFHIGSHYSVVFSSYANFCDLVLLFFVPFLFLLYGSTRGGLWWVSENAANIRSIRVVNGFVALVFVVIALEVRVVFHSFGRYIQVPAPLNYVLVTITMLGGAGAAGAYAMGMVSDALSSVAFTTSAIVVSAAGAVVVGYPVLEGMV